MRSAETGESGSTLACAYAAAHGLPRSVDALREHTLIGGGGKGVWQVYRSWLKENGLETAVALHHDTVTGVIAAVRAGFGVAILPSLIGEPDPKLVRCLPLMPRSAPGLWLLTHERVRHIPRVRLVLEFVADRLNGLMRERGKEAAKPLDVAERP